MRHGSLFSGIGGFDLASEWMGWENVFHCEWMEFPRNVLDYYWPDADSHVDICKTDFKKYEGTIDIISGGFPCQPFSIAGKRKGTDDERYLWGEMLRAIQEIKPKYVIAENVFGITNIDGGLVFQQVCLDLENEGYEVQPFIIPAAAKNAPHRRDRCWFVAIKNSLHCGCVHGESQQEGADIREQWNTGTGSADGIHLSKGFIADSKCSRHRGKSKESGNIKSGKIGELVSDVRQYENEIRCKIERCGEITTHSNCKRQARKWKQRSTTKERERREKRFGQLGNIQYQWEKFPTQSPICGGDDGIPTELDGITFSKWRAESIKGYGNAIVPQIALQLFQIIETL